MEPTRNLAELVKLLKGSPPRRVVVAAGHDENSIQAAARAVSEGIARVTLVGDRTRIEVLCKQYSIDSGAFEVIDEKDLGQAGTIARDLVRAREADVLMKGLIGTDKYMHLILDKEKGLLPRGAVLAHVAVLDIPAYQKLHEKLLFVSDAAIIPAPDLETKLKIVSYVVAAARSFGIERPRVALLAASEKVTDRMPATIDAAIIAKMADRGQIANAIVDGPLALDVALSTEACAIKELKSPVEGAADALIFPNIETGNVFYKSATILAGAIPASVVAGASAPCVLTSRADSEDSKFYSIAFGCKLVNGKCREE